MNNKVEQFNGDRVSKVYESLLFFGGFSFILIILNVIINFLVRFSTNNMNIFLIGVLFLIVVGHMLTLICVLVFFFRVFINLCVLQFRRLNKK